MGIMKTEKALDIKERLDDIITTLDLGHIIDARILCMRSQGAKARAYARIWSLPSIWRNALEIGPFYVIEVLSENFDHLDDERKTQILIHELLHIPRRFSGGLVPHKNRGGRIDPATVSKVYEEYKKRKQEKKE